MDHSLRDGVRGGDAGSFGELYERYATRVYNYCFRATADWSVAEDCVSVVFLEAWRRRSDVWDSEESLLPWLLGVAHNVVRNRRRSFLRHRAALERVRPPEPVPDFAEDAAGRIDDARYLEQVLAQVRRLRRAEQDVLMLCGWSELSYEETARLLDIPVGTVRSRLSRARGRLRELVERSGKYLDDRATAVRPVGRS